MDPGEPYLSGEEGHGRAVDPGVVSCGGHALQVVLALLRGDASAGQLTVVHCDLISFHRLLHGNQSICQQQQQQHVHRLNRCRRSLTELRYVCDDQECNDSIDS